MAEPAVVALSPEQRVVLSVPDGWGRQRARARLEALADCHVVDLVRAPQEWAWLRRLSLQGEVTLDPLLASTVAQLSSGAGTAPPLAPIPVREQLGYLLEASKVRSKVTDAVWGLRAGAEYPCSAILTVHKWTELRHVVVETGRLAERTIIVRQPRLQITVEAARRWIWLEGVDSPETFLSRFEFSPRLSVPDLMPDRYEAALRAVRSVERDFGFQLHDWQREDAAVAATVGRALLAVSQGLGKTILTMTIVEALRRFHPGAQVPFLAVVPQDLIRQWQREAYRFFRRSFVRIDSVAAAYQTEAAHREGRTLRQPSLIAPEARRLVSSGSDAWFLTHYEAISRTGRREEVSDEGERLLWTKPTGAALATVFRRGLIALDEATKIKGDTTAVSLGIRGLRSRFRLALSGTPVRNTLPDLFWLLWWVGGNRTALFPYAYNDGLRALLRDFGTTERVGLTTSTKSVPEPGSPQVLRRLLAPLVIRRTEASLETPLVPLRFSVVRVPWGTRQREQYENWLDPVRFAAYWKRTHPEADSLSQSAVRKHGAALGQLVHLDYATTVPESESARDNDPRGGPSNWTPKALYVLRTIRSHVRQGERVLFGSNLLGNVVWTAEQLRALGLRASSLAIPTERPGAGNRLVSLGPDPRQDAVEEFLHEGGQVLCAGLQSLALGHDLHQVSTVVVAGLPYDLMTLEQFLARVRRLRSPKPVTVVVVLTAGSLDERKWELLERKRKAAAAVFCDPVGLVREEAGLLDREQLLAQVRQDAVKAAQWQTEAEEQLEAQFRALCMEPATPSLESMGVERSGTVMRALQELPASAEYAATFEVAAALTSGYSVPSALGVVAEPLAGSPGLSQLSRRGRVLGMGSAADVAAGLCAVLGDAQEVERALRLARMPEAERQRHFGWWRHGEHSWLVVSEAERWWRHGAYTWRLE